MVRITASLMPRSITVTSATLALLLAIAPLPRVMAQDKPSGGTPSDDSIRRALVYLQESQKPDGGWDAGFGRATSVTSLAVMSFLASGHVPGEPGPYRETIDRGIRYVLTHQKGQRAARDQHQPRADVLPRDQHLDARRGRGDDQ